MVNTIDGMHDFINTYYPFVYVKLKHKCICVCVSNSRCRTLNLLYHLEMAHNLICYLHILRTFRCLSIHFSMHIHTHTPHGRFDLIPDEWDLVCVCGSGWITCVLFNHIWKFLFVACFLSYLFPYVVCGCARAVVFTWTLTYLLLNSWHATFCPHTPTLETDYNNIRLTFTRKSAVTYDLSMFYKTIRTLFSHPN